MEKSIEKRITSQPYKPSTYVQLTSFPIGSLRNPGFGINCFDVMIPLGGQERFEVKKEDEVVPGSFEDLKKPNSTNKQEGFGNTNLNELVLAANDEKLKKLGNVFQAMQNASVKTGSLVYQPNKKKIEKKRVSKKHKFKIV